MTPAFRRMTLAAVMILPPLGIAGCNRADNPKLAEAPPYTPPANPEPPNIPGRKDTYGSNPKYQEIMEKRAKAQAGR